jgi:hypothetical protein
MIISSFIIQANVITIVNYDCKTFIVQAIGYNSKVFISALKKSFIVQVQIELFFFLLGGFIKG